MAYFQRRKGEVSAAIGSPQHFGAAMVVISMAGMQTHRTELGTVVVPIYPRHSVALVQ